MKQILKVQKTLVFVPSYLIQTDLIEKELRQILGDGGGMFPTTVSTQVIANLSFHAVAVPEPASGVLLALGLGVLGARRSQRRRGAERRGQGAAK